jgi:cytochrome b561
VKDRTRFAVPQRVIHWGMAVCIIAMLFIGIGMISVITPKYLTLIQIHKTLGIVIFGLAVLRLAMRLYYGAPPLPKEMPFMLWFAAVSSQYVFYGLMFAMPLIGWAMLSAAAHPVVLFGSVHLPGIVPVNAGLFALLQKAHYWLGLSFFALVLAHIAGLLFHKLVRQDGVFDTMATLKRDEREA